MSLAHTPERGRSHQAAAVLQDLVGRYPLSAEETSVRSFGGTVREANRDLIKNLSALPALLDSRLAGVGTPDGALRALTDIHDICRDFLPENVGGVASVLAVSGVVRWACPKDSAGLTMGLLDGIEAIAGHAARISRRIADQYPDNPDIGAMNERVSALCDKRKSAVEQARSGEAMAIAQRFYDTSVSVDACTGLRDPRIHNAWIVALDNPHDCLDQADRLLEVAREDDIPESERDLMTNDPPYQSMRINTARKVLSCITYALKVFDDGSAGHGKLMADFYDRVNQMDSLERSHGRSRSDTASAKRKERPAAELGT